MGEQSEEAVSLCLSASVSGRPRLLRHAAELVPEPHLRLTLLLGFTTDPHPRVRSVSLHALSALALSAHIHSLDLLRASYSRASALLSDPDHSVRSAAIPAVCAWGSKLLSAYDAEMKAQCSDQLFVKICSMARDMNMKVRVETFDALSKTEMVSEDILLQCLSKKVLGSVKENKSLGRCCDEPFEVVVSSVAGVLLHGLEDEFYEVRKSACRSLSSLILISTSFAVEALELAMDMLNDDSLSVRLQILDTMCHMAVCDRLKLQVKHMKMFLGPLIDKDASIRHSARKILKLVKLSIFESFKLAIDALLQNLAQYPEDESDIFSVLFHIGQHHGNFVVRIIEDVSQQIEPTSEGKSDFDNPRVAALIVFAISAPLLGENACTVSPVIYSYAVTMLGRISSALSKVTDQSSLLAYLVQCSRFTRVSAAEFKQRKQRVISNDNGVGDLDCILDFNPMSSQKYIERISDLQYPEELRKLANSIQDYKDEVFDEVIKSINAILARVTDTWPLVQSGNTHEVLRTLRSCKEELATFNSNSVKSSSVVAFTYQYIRIIELVSELWKRFRTPKFFACETGTLDFLFEKLDRRLRDLMNRFVGLSSEEELHILELKLVVCTVGLSRHSNLRRLTSTISRIESLNKEGSVEPSEFVTEVCKSRHEMNESRNIDTPTLHQFKRSAQLFCLKRIAFHGEFKHLKADLSVPGNDFVNPLCFIPGLPVGIPCRVSLHNVLAENRLWLRMRMDDESTQFIFLNPNQYEDSDNGCRRFTILVPFYGTPKAVCFSLKLCICMECPYEDLFERGFAGGPKHELAYLCEEKQVFLCSSPNDNRMLGL